MSLITLRNVQKIYPAPSANGSEVRALDGLNLSVNEGEVRGLLGPNGAGKTTTVKILTTLIQPTFGTATVADMDVVREAAKVREIIGTSGQYATIDEQLTGYENLLMIGRLFHLGDRRARQRANELLEVFNLTKAAHRPVKSFSGGMRRRVDLAASLVNDPLILILDEPTTGLDPAARLSLWEIIRARVAAGTTLLLTTQYLEEADQLADNISVIDHGRVIAEGTADELKAHIGGQRITLTLVDATDIPTARTILGAHSLGTINEQDRTLTAQVSDGPAALEAVITAIRSQGIAVHDVGMQRPTLDDVFLQLTGGKAGDGQ